MANLTVQQITPAGINPAFTPAGVGGDTFTTDGRTQLRVKNASGSAITVTVVSPQKCNQGVNHNLVVSVPAGETREIGPIEKTRFTNTTSGRVSVTYSSVTSVTVAVVGG